MKENKYIGNKEKLRRANQKIVFLIKENKKKKAEIADLKQAVDQIYSDYQDAGKKMFEYAETLDKVKEFLNTEITYKKQNNELIDMAMEEVLRQLNMYKEKILKLIEGAEESETKI